MCLLRWTSLTVLVGPNASGKSNLLDILRFIRDALRFDLEVAIAFRNGMEEWMRHEWRMETWKWRSGSPQLCVIAVPKVATTRSSTDSPLPAWATDDTKSAVNMGRLE